MAKNITYKFFSANETPPSWLLDGFHNVPSAMVNVGALGRSIDTAMLNNFPNQTAMIAAMQQWSYVLDINFSETSGVSNISFGTWKPVTQNTGTATSFTGYGADNYAVLVNMRSGFNKEFNETAAIGNWGGWSYMHEFLHLLAGDTDLETSSKDLRHTILPYPTRNPDGSINGSVKIPLTPGMNDISRLQRLTDANGNLLYGASHAQDGDTNYIFTQTSANLGHGNLLAGIASANLANYVMTIWDGGGINNIDASALSTKTFINLNPGTFSAIGTDTNTSNELSTDLNVGLAGGSIIMNARGGSASDYILGNDQNNVLEGNDGADILDGGKGHDDLYGGFGSDNLTGGEGNDYLNGGFGYDIYNVGAGDVIEDIDGQGAVLADGSTLSLVSASQLVNNDLVVNTSGGSFIIKNFQEGDLGIYLSRVIAGNSITINQQYVEVTGLGLQEAYVQDNVSGGNGNDDINNFTRGNDVINSYDGNDTIRVGSFNGDSRYFINAGAGNDYIYFNGASPIGVPENIADIVFGYGSGVDTLQISGSVGGQINLNFFNVNSADAYGFWESNTTYRVVLKNGENIAIENYHSADVNMSFSDGGTTPLNSLPSYSVVGSSKSDYTGGAGYIYGFDGNDTVSGSSGNDTLDGGEGIDFLNGGLGRDTYRFGVGYGQDFILEDYLSEGNTLKIVGNVDPESIQVYFESSGRLVFSINQDEKITINNWANIDEVIFENGTYWNQSTILNKAGNGRDNVFTGSAGGFFQGGSGNDQFFNDSGSDTYFFNAGDGLDSISDDSTLDPNSIDKIILGSGITTSHLLVSQSGNNLTIKVGATDEITINNWYAKDANRIEQLLFADGTIWTKSQLNNFGLVGTESDETLKGTTDAENIFNGQGGNDSMYGGRVADTYIFNIGDGIDKIFEALDTDLSSVDKIQLGAGVTTSDVSMVWSDLDLVLQIGTANDFIYVQNWGLGDSWRVEEVVFSDGTIWNKSILNDLWLVRNGDDDPEYLTGKSIGTNDTIFGNGGNDTLLGLSGNDYLDGGWGSDQLLGGDGADTLIGGEDSDTLYGGNGADTYVFNSGDDFDSIIEEGDDGAIDSIKLGSGINVENLITFNNQQGDLLLFLGNGDRITINNWFVDPKYQIEKFIFSDGSILTKDQLPAPQLDVLVQYGTLGNDFLQSYDFGGVNEIYGLEGNDSISGSYFDDILNGGEGDDYLQDTWGTNTLIGGLGNDILEGGGFDDTFVFNIGDGEDTIYESSKLSLNDQIQFGAGITLTNLSFQQIDNDLIINVGNGTDHIVIKNWFFGAKIETLKFANGATLNILTGSLEGGDVFGTPTNDILLGFEGSDVLSGEDGVDVLVGGGGNDTYIIDSSTDTIIETSTGGVDTVQSSVTYTLGANSNLENLTLTGSAAINGTGNNVDNVLVGNSANNTLNGGNGSDTLDGGAGIDTLIGGAGDDTYIIDSTTDTITEWASGGADTVISSVAYTLGSYLENLTIAGTSNLSGFGNSLNNIIIGNTGANTLNGWGGIDTLIGGAGNDVYIIDTNTDIIIENANEGTDTVRSDVSYALGANTENLILTTAIGAINGTGNALSNAITGNAYDNILDGGAGNDYLVGGNGNDTYIVDTTGDTIVENANGGVDTVKSSVTFSMGSSSNVENLILTGTAAINGTGNSLTNYLLGNSGNNTLTDTAGGNDIVQGLVGNDTLNDTNGNNLLDGGVGSDVITAGNGNDLIIGGKNNDTVTTGVGADVILFNKGDGADTVNASVGSDNTLSLGGNFAYSDLSLTKSANDLILKMGTSDQITLKGWYDTSANNKSVLNLQVIAESIQGFSLGGSDTLRNNKVETFNFANLVAAFDTAGATANWQLTDARLAAHLSSGSDSTTIGGDIAYQYGKSGSLTGVGILAAQSVINGSNVGQSAQAFNDASSWANETIKLS